MISMDHAFTGKENKPIVVCYYESDKMVWAMAIHRKGNPGRVAQRVAKWISHLGHAKVILKTNQEPAIKDPSEDAKIIRLENLKEISKQVGSLQEIRVIPEHSPMGESQANGAVESMIKRLKGQMRTWKLVLENKPGAKIEE